MQLSYDESHVRAVAELFDAAYYLATNQDVREHGIDPLTHFLTTGWREGRNPSCDFDVAYYQQTNPDVVAAGLNPLVHYALSGAREGRLPRRPLDSVRRHLDNARAPSARVDAWEAAADLSPALSRAALARSLASAVASRDALVVSISHDDYDRNFGGVQKAIRDEQIAAERMNWGYLHLSPAAPLPMLAEPTLAGSFRFGLRLGSDWLGVATATDLVAALTEFRSDGVPIFLVLHHLMGHAPEVLLELAAVTAEPTIVWVHDYFTLCPSYNLLRNDVRFCGAPSAMSAACGICAYGPDRAEHLRRVRAFFEAVRPVILAPSEAALDLWRRRSELAHREAHVQPLARLVLAPEQLNTEPMRALRIAHLGARNLPKGWPVFEQLALRFAKDPDYTFYQLGVLHGAPISCCIRNVNVQVSREQPEAMIETIAEHRIDVVVSWSLWPETFCFAAHEALAGGSFVLARAAAGNVAHTIKKIAPEQGHVLEDEGLLFELFEEGRLRNMLRTARCRRGVLIAESGSAPWLRRLARWGNLPRAKLSSGACL